MAGHRTSTGSRFDPTLAMATERIRRLHLEAHGERLAAGARTPRRSRIRVRLGQALIAIGATLVAPADPRQPSLAD